MAHQRERRQKMLAELSVRHPGGAFTIGFEREGVNKDRPAVEKLDVIGTGIFE